jgi:hypothetical protein
MSTEDAINVETDILLKGCMYLVLTIVAYIHMHRMTDKND